MRLLTDQILKDYIELNKQIDKLQKRREKFRLDLIDCGSLETNEYILEVEKRKRESLIGVTEAEEKLGRKRLEKLGIIKKIRYVAVTVKKRSA